MVCDGTKSTKFDHFVAPMFYVREYGTVPLNQRLNYGLKKNALSR